MGELIPYEVFKKEREKREQNRLRRKYEPLPSSLYGWSRSLLGMDPLDWDDIAVWGEEITAIPEPIDLFGIPYKEGDDKNLE